MATKTSTASEFNFPKRADPDRVKVGVKWNMKDEFQQSWGVYTLTFMDTEFVRGREKMLAAATQYSDLLESGEMTHQDIGIRVFCENYLIDWEIPVEIWSDNGEPVKFTPDNAVKFLSQEPTIWLVEKLLALSQDITKFGYLKNVKGKPTNLKN